MGCETHDDRTMNFEGIRIASSPRSPGPSGGATASEQDESGSVDVAPVVLIVDDTDDTRLVYAEIFAEAGFRVEEATNGQEALDIIAEAKPAVVVMDMSMPVMDGWEATRRIKEHPSTAHVIVIAVTGHGTQLGMERAIDAGASVVLSKPCLPNDVLARARELLASARAVH